MKTVSGKLPEDTGNGSAVDLDKVVETGAVKEQSCENTEGVSFKLALCISFLSSIITAGAMLMAYDHFVAQKIVTVDIKGYITQVRDQFVAGKINEVQMRAAFDQMEHVVKNIPKNKVVIMGDAVIHGVQKVDIPLPAPQVSNAQP